MNTHSINNKRLAQNTLLLYFRMLITMLISLYTSRVILDVLGITDFGIYNVVGGTVAMFGIISGALSTAISRFLNIEMGKSNDPHKLSCILSSAVNIHIILAVIIILLAESFIPWFINNKMTIPPERVFAANCVFHCSIITFAINLISIPYNACIIAHENMKIYAYISIFEAVSKLLIAYILLLKTNIDILVLYGILMLIISLIIRLIYQLYCKKHYAESKYKLYFNWNLTKQIFSFTSWNIIGSSSVILSDQGVNILLNIFCSPIINAARGIAIQVNTAVNSFSQNFMVALNPQIIKSYGCKDLNSYKNLIINGSRFSVCLLSLLSLPILLETDYILNLWLKETPEHTANFIRLTLLFGISEAFSSTFTTGLLATGNIKKLQLLIGGCRLLNFPLSYIGLYLFKLPELTLFIAIILSQATLLVRLKLLKNIINVSIYEYYISVVIKQFLSLLGVFIITYFIINIFNESFGRFLLTVLISITLYIITIYYIICNKNEINLIKSIIKNKIKKHEIKKNNIKNPIS